jgi:hypothetical protein
VDLTVGETALIGTVAAVASSVLTYLATRRASHEAVQASKESVAAQQYTSQAAINSQKAIAEATLLTQHQVALQDRLFDKRYDAYSAFITEAVQFLDAIIKIMSADAPLSEMKNLIDSKNNPLIDRLVACSPLAEGALRRALNAFSEKLNEVHHEVYGDVRSTLEVAKAHAPLTDVEKLHLLDRPPDMTPDAYRARIRGWHDSLVNALNPVELAVRSELQRR